MIEEPIKSIEVAIRLIPNAHARDERIKRPMNRRRIIDRLTIEGVGENPTW